MRIGCSVPGGSMGGKRMTIPAGVAANVEAEMRAASVARRRFRHREHMKEWRANPKHRETERKKRYREYVIKKQRSAERLRLRPYTGVHGQPLCGFCGLGRPVEIVERLRISETGDEEYVRVLIPYCGHC